MRKLRYYRYFGKFYEFEGMLGWMPFYKVLILVLRGDYSKVEWIPQSMVRFK